MITIILLAILIIACTYFIYTQLGKLHTSICHCIDRRQIELEKFIQVFVGKSEFNIINILNGKSEPIVTLNPSFYQSSGTGVMECRAYPFKSDITYTIGDQVTLHGQLYVYSPSTDMLKRNPELRYTTGSFVHEYWRHLGNIITSCTTDINDPLGWDKPNTPQEDYEAGMTFRRMSDAHGCNPTYWYTYGKLMGWNKNKRITRTRRKIDGSIHSSGHSDNHNDTTDLRD